jgi:signal transduction histidine kinase
MPAAIRECVFDPFFTTKDRTQHSGLGLWISRSIIQEHGGELRVESPSTACRAGEEGRGTRVHVDLPLV